MRTCQLSIHAKTGECRSQSEWGGQSILVYRDVYRPGDYIVLKTDAARQFWEIRLEDSMLPAIVFLEDKILRFDIPFEDNKIPYSPKSFSGGLHMLTARPADEHMIYMRRNLALNPYDNSNIAGVFPHASANIETRGEAVFAARNTIDGVYANSFHGEYPYQSWGIDRNPDAALKIDLGIPCLVDEIRLTLRADFPHDNYWVRANLDFSDGSIETVDLVKNALPQDFRFPEKNVQWVILNKLIQSDEPSPFPALTQFEIWGTVKKGK
jgi:hypothetical protein